MPGFGDIDPQFVVTVIVTFIIAITVHEFMHAWTAWMLGDDTARLLGRISLNPAVHFDPVGALMFVLIALGFPALAWGRPVPVNDSRLRPVGRFGRQGSMALVSLAGPLSNVVLGAVAAGTLRFSAYSGASLGAAIDGFLQIFMWVNFSLAAFNMIPLPPLDGSRILMALLPPFWRPVLAPLERYGIAILFLLILLGGAVAGSVIGAIVNPVRDLLLRLFAGI
ncbi:MAG: site-2 protease family protein [Thermomicrobiales bacterium]